MIALSHAFFKRAPRLSMSVVFTALACLVPGSSAWAQTAYPSKPIRIIVPVSAGGNTDMIARMFAKKLAENLGQPAVVENKPGASAIIGTELVARSAPDGHTLLVVGALGAGHVMNPSLFAKLPYDTLRDFAAISGLTRVPLAMVVNPALPVTTVKGLIDYAKAQPGALNVATGGRGTAANLATELFMSLSGTKVTQVHYKGNAPGLADTVAGQTSMMIDTLPTALQQVKAGRLRILAVTSAERASVLPDVPTVAEAGIPGYEMSVVNGLFAPAATPRDVVRRLAGEVARFARDPEARNFFGPQGSDMVSNTPEEFTTQVEADIAKWGKIIRAAGIKPD